MKRPFPLSRRQLLLALAFLFAFAGITLFLFRYKREEKQFSHITSQLFTDEMTSSTLNMHYTIANPADFGIYSYKPILPSYSKTGTLKGQAATENVIAALKSLNPEKLSDADSYTHRLLLRSLDNSLKAGSFVYYKEPLSPLLRHAVPASHPLSGVRLPHRTGRDGLSFHLRSDG